MKKIIALLLAMLMVISLAACNGDPAGNKGNDSTDGTEEQVTAMPEDEAAIARDAGTLVADALTGYDKAENGTWYYSNYANYKDFNEDGEIKVAFICKFSGAWFTPKQEALGETLSAAGYTYQFFDCNSDTQLFIDYVQNAINQEFDIVVLTPPNTTLLAEAVALLQEEGIAYMTTDDPGPDKYGFYAPHYGLDDYYLHNELGKACGNHLKESGWMDDIAADFSNLKLLICDIPTVEAVHRRNLGFWDGIIETIGIPESQIQVLDITASDALTTKFSATLQDDASKGIEKWIISNGGGGAAFAVPIAQELGMDMSKIVWADCFSDASMMALMKENADLHKNCWGVGLVSAPSGNGIGEVIIDLVENGTPIPCFTPYALNIVNDETVDEFYATYYGG